MKRLLVALAAACLVLMGAGVPGPSEVRLRQGYGETSPELDERRRVEGSRLVSAQDISLEYRVKAAYLFNFVKFVAWPPSAFAGRPPLTICVARSNPFGAVLEATIRGETLEGRPIVARIVDDADSLCHVLFVPRGVNVSSFVRRTSTTPVLTVGETMDFLDQGGIVSFLLEGGHVKFEISPEAASRHNLVISSRLLRLARVRDSEVRR